MHYNSMRKDRLIVIIRVSSWLLLYLPLILIFVSLFKFIEALPHGLSAQIIIDEVRIIFIYGILILISHLLDSFAYKMKNDIETQLIGYLLSNAAPVSVRKVSEILNIRERSVINMFLKVKSEGKLRDFTFNSDNGEIIPPITHLEIPITLTPQSSSSMREELLLRAKLKELEILRIEGRISEKAYEELKKELMEKSQ